MESFKKLQPALSDGLRALCFLPGPFHALSTYNVQLTADGRSHSSATFYDGITPTFALEWKISRHIYCFKHIGSSRVTKKNQPAATSCQAAFLGHMSHLQYCATSLLVFLFCIQWGGQ